MTGSSPGQGREELALAGKLEQCPLTDAALRAGELSLAQAIEIARTEKALPGSEASMLALAGTMSLGSLRDEGRRRRLADLDPGEAYKRQHRERSFRSWTDAAGMVRFRGALTPDKGVPFLSRLNALCDRITDQARAAGSNESRPAHAADAFVALFEDDCTCVGSAGSAGTAGVPDPSSGAADEAGVDVPSAPASAGGSADGQSPGTKPKRPRPVELVLLWTLLRRCGATPIRERCARSWASGRRRTQSLEVWPLMPS